jgi:Tfp pilus assembly protein PilF
MNKRFADSNVIQKEIAKANYAMSVRKYDTVLTIMQQALSEHPGNCLALFFMAQVYAIQKNFPAAQEALNEALSQDPEYSGAHRLYGLVLEEIKDYDQAEQAFQAAIAVQTAYPATYAEAHVSYGEFLLNVRHDQEKAKEHCQKALEIHPEYLPARRLLARIFIAEGDVQQAEEVYLSALRLAPNNSTLHNSYGIFIMEDKHDPRAAFEHFRIALVSDPTNEVYRKNFFLALKAKNRFYWLFWQYASFRRKLRWRFTIVTICIGLLMRGLYIEAHNVGSPLVEALFIVIILLYLLFFIYRLTINPLFNLFIKRGWIK